jgi:hypothetical protein
MRPFLLIAALLGLLAATACGGDAQRSGEVEDVAQGKLHFLGEGEFIDSKPITGSEASFTSVRGGLPGVVSRADAIVVAEIVNIVDVTVSTMPAEPNWPWPTAELEVGRLTTYSGRVEQWLKGSGPDEVLITGFGGITESGANFVDGDFLLDPGRRYVLALYEKARACQDLASTREPGLVLAPLR